MFIIRFKKLLIKILFNLKFIYFSINDIRAEKNLLKFFQKFKYVVFYIKIVFIKF